MHGDRRQHAGRFGWPAARAQRARRYRSVTAWAWRLGRRRVYDRACSLRDRAVARGGLRARRGAWSRRCWPRAPRPCWRCPWGTRRAPCTPSSPPPPRGRAVVRARDRVQPRRIRRPRARPSARRSTTTCATSSTTTSTCRRARIHVPDGAAADLDAAAAGYEQAIAGAGGFDLACSALAATATSRSTSPGRRSTRARASSRWRPTTRAAAARRLRRRRGRAAPGADHRHRDHPGGAPVRVDRLRRRQGGDRARASKVRSARTFRRRAAACTRHHRHRRRRGRFALDTVVRG